MNLDTQKILKTLNPNKIWVPVAISLGFVIFLILSDDSFTPQKINLIFQARLLPVLLAVAVLLLKDLAYIYRIRTLTNEDLSWTSSIYVILLWEFASAVTPSAVGGTAVAVFILLKEGINLGKSISYTMLSAILDNMFFVLFAPLALVLIGTSNFPDFAGTLQGLFMSSYLLIAIYTFIMIFALFFKPRLFKWLLIKITSIKFLRKWRYAAYQHGNEVMWASSLIKGKKRSYWIKIILATIVAWVTRYAILNCIIAAYTTDLSFGDHLMILGKHLILWVIMLVSPTPGGSGLAENFFIQLFDGYLVEYTLGTTLFWRLLTYYPYLIIGALVLPRWIKKVFVKKKQSPRES